MSGLFTKRAPPFPMLPGPVWVLWPESFRPRNVIGVRV